MALIKLLSSQAHPVISYKGLMMTPSVETCRHFNWK